MNNITNQAGCKIDLTIAIPESALNLDGELAIGITPRGGVSWTGSSAQLLAEGLIPSKFTWPGDKENGVFWESGGFCFTVRRSKYRKFGRERVRTEDEDYWVLHRSLKGPGYAGALAARLYEKKSSVEKEIFSQSPKGIEQFYAKWAAHSDKDFQALLAKVLPKKAPSRVRAAKIAKESITAQ